MCAEYKNTNTPTLPEIEQEKRFLTDELKALPVEPTYEAVKDMLNEGRFDIFHFAGHGIARDGFTQAVIQLADKEPRVGDFQEIDFESDDEPQTGDGGAPQGDFADCIDDYAGDDFAPEAEEPDDPGVDQPADDSAPDDESDADY